jgi:hypothetical protein
MKNKLSLFTLVAVVALLASGLGSALGVSAGFQSSARQSSGISASPLVPVGSGFTYQGSLTQSGGPANGLYDFIFTLYDAQTGGNPVGSPVNLAGQQVTSGLFNVTLDFGANVFQGDARWLEIAVRVAGSGDYTTLSPRQPLTPAPYAQSAPWGGVTGKPWIYNTRRSANAVTTLDSTGTVGQYASMAIGVDGLGLVSYYDATNGDLKVAHCNNLECTSAATYTLDSAGDVGRFTAITIGTDGLGLIVYFDGPAAGAGNIKVAHCDNIECSSATVAMFAAASSAGGLYPSITIGTDQLALLAYKSSGGALVIAHCTDLACTAGTSITLAGEAPKGTSIAIGSDGLGLIVYQNGNNGLRAAHCNNVACTSASLNTIDSTTSGASPSLLIGNDGLPLISYATSESNSSVNALKIANCIRPDCAFSTLTTMSGYGRFTALPTSLTLGPDGFGLLTFYDSLSSGTWIIGHCLDFDCSSISTASFDTIVTFPVGTYSSLATGADGLPLIAYYDSANDDLKVRHCASLYCVPYKTIGR